MDRGAEIPATKLAGLFEPHFAQQQGRIDAGLGLFVCKHIIESHDGTLVVHSDSSAGTTFTVELPRQGPSPKAECTPRHRCAKLEDAWPQVWASPSPAVRDH